MKRAGRILTITAATFTAAAVAALGTAWVSLNATMATLNTPAVTPAPNLTGAAGAAAALPLPQPDTPTPATTSPRNATNILLLGSDARNDPHDSRSDTIILAHLSADGTWAHLLSIPRDLVVTIPTTNPVCGGGSYDTTERINAAWAYGGADCAAITVANTTGLPIDHVVSADFQGFAATVDAIGGWSTCLNQPVSDSDAEISLPAGAQTLTGQETLGLMRIRKTLGNGSDIDRTGRQQYILTSIAGQLRTQVTNPATAARLVSTATQHVAIDATLANPVTAAKLAYDVRNATISTSTLPWLPEPGNPARVIEDQQNAAYILSDLQRDVPPGTTAAELAPPPSPASQETPQPAPAAGTPAPNAPPPFCG